MHVLCSAVSDRHWNLSNCCGNMQKTFWNGSFCLSRYVCVGVVTTSTRAHTTGRRGAPSTSSTIYLPSRLSWSDVQSSQWSRSQSYILRSWEMIRRVAVQHNVLNMREPTGKEPSKRSWCIKRRSERLLASDRHEKFATQSAVRWRNKKDMSWEWSFTLAEREREPSAQNYLWSSIELRTTSTTISLCSTEQNEERNIKNRGAEHSDGIVLHGRSSILRQKCG